jgi:hypothetical protein
VGFELDIKYLAHRFASPNVPRGALYLPKLGGGFVQGTSHSHNSQKILKNFYNQNTIVLNIIINFAKY